MFHLPSSNGAVVLMKRGLMVFAPVGTLSGVFTRLLEGAFYRVSNYVGRGWKWGLSLTCWTSTSYNPNYCMWELL